MYERFTDRARKVMQLANQEAQRFNHEYIGTEHVLLGLIKEGSGVAANVLKNLDVDLRKIRLEVEKLVQSGPDMVTMGKLPQTPRAKKVIEYSMEEARHLNHNYVGTEHILLGLLREQEGVAAQVLMNLGLKLEEVREEVLNLLGHGLEGEESGGRGRAGSGGAAGGGGGEGGEERERGKSSKSKTPALDSFGRDLTDRSIDAGTHEHRRGSVEQGSLIADCVRTSWRVRTVGRTSGRRRTGHRLPNGTLLRIFGAMFRFDLATTWRCAP